MKENEIIDVHMHCIYGVDDGAKDFKESMGLISLASKQGIKKIVCTPHNIAFDNNYIGVIEKYKELRVHAAEKYNSMKLYLGSEIEYNKRDFDIITDKIKMKTYPTINNTNYLLIEFQLDIPVKDIIYICSKLISYGYVPVIAHTERYKNLQEEYYRLVDLQDIGCKIQVNAYSLVNETNENVKDMARLIIRNKFASYIGSDGHGLNHRPPIYIDGLEYLKENISSSYYKQLIYANAVEDFKL